MSMSLLNFWKIAYRDLGRNRRRSLLTIIAVALGLALLIVMNGMIAGIMGESLQNSIRLRTGHLQLRAASYAEDQLSLQWQDLLAEPENLAAQVRQLPEVQAVAPVLWAGGILAAGDESASLQIYGIQEQSSIYTPIRSAVVAGSYLDAQDRNGILIGRHLAESMGLAIDRKVSLAIVSSDGRVDEGIFTIRGLFATGVPSYDESAVLMPLERAQAFAQVGDRASAIFILLNNQNDTTRVASTLQSPNASLKTWEQLNESFLQAFQAAQGFYLILDLIVMLIVAVIIANTLLMAVFERIREMGILAALGMRGRQIMVLFVLQAVALGLAGIVLGLVVGAFGVMYLAAVGIPLNAAANSVNASIALGSVVHAQFDPATFAVLSLITLVIIMLAALYPAWYAARLEPVVALRG